MGHEIGLLDAEVTFRDSKRLKFARRSLLMALIERSAAVAPVILYWGNNYLLMILIERMSNGPLFRKKVIPKFTLYVMVPNLY